MSAREHGGELSCSTHVVRAAHTTSLLLVRRGPKGRREGGSADTSDVRRALLPGGRSTLRQAMSKPRDRDGLEAGRGVWANPGNKLRRCSGGVAQRRVAQRQSVGVDAEAGLLVADRLPARAFTSYQYVLPSPLTEVSVYETDVRPVTLPTAL